MESIETRDRKGSGQGLWGLLLLGAGAALMMANALPETLIIVLVMAGISVGLRVAYTLDKSRRWAQIGSNITGVVTLIMVAVFLTEEVNLSEELVIPLMMGGLGIWAFAAQRAGYAGRWALISAYLLWGIAAIGSVVYMTEVANVDEELAIGTFFMILGGVFYWLHRRHPDSTTYRNLAYVGLIFGAVGVSVFVIGNSQLQETLVISMLFMAFGTAAFVLRNPEKPRHLTFAYVLWGIAGIGLMAFLIDERIIPESIAGTLLFGSIGTGVYLGYLNDRARTGWRTLAYVCWGLAGVGLLVFLTDDLRLEDDLWRIAPFLMILGGGYLLFQQSGAKPARMEGRQEPLAKPAPEAKPATASGPVAAFEPLDIKKKDR